MSQPCVAETQEKDWYHQADWIARHEQLVKDKDTAKDCRVVFLGDSITEGWGGEGNARGRSISPTSSP